MSINTNEQMVYKGNIEKDLNQSENLYIKNNHSLKTINHCRITSKGSTKF